MNDLCMVDYYWEEKRMLQSDNPDERKEGFHRLMEAAKNGDPKAQAIIGEGYYDGFDYEQDYEKAFYWCKKASIAGEGYSLSILAKMYEYGHGVEQDYIEAVRWYRKEVSNGFTYVSDDMYRCIEKMEQEGIPTQEAMHGLPKQYMAAYEEWFAEENKEKTICHTPTQIGDLFYMGQYFIGEEGKKEPILWRVIGKEDHKLLAISEYCLHWLPYDGNYYDFISELYEDGFSEEEKARLVKAEETSNYLFALSVKEADNYFKNNPQRRATATPYAVLKGAHTVYDDAVFREFKGKEKRLLHAVCWWLRTKGFTPSYVADVMPDGWVCASGDEFEEAGGVRPAMWISI